CCCRRVERIVEAGGGSAAAPTGYGQSRLLGGCQRDQLPAEEVSCGPVAAQSAGPPSTGGLCGQRMTASHGGGDRLQPLTQPYHIPFPCLPADGLVGTAVDKQDAAGQWLPGFRIGQDVSDHGQ